MKLRTFTYLDILQPQTTGFLQTVVPGFIPLENQAALFVEISPGIAINNLANIALKQTSALMGMLVVERAYGLLELHHFDQGQVRQAGDAILQHLDVREEDALKPKLMSSTILNGIEGYQAQLINKMRHGNMICQKESLYIMEVAPAGYAAIAANEAEKAANINILEFVTFGSVGRLWLGGDEENIKEAAKAVESTIKALSK